MKAARVRVQNYRNINDSGWVPLEKVTALVGRNESGKTALLKALHKFNPATPEPYDPQREFPRDRYTRDYIAKGSKGGDWPVCSVAFFLPDNVKAEITALLEPGQTTPNQAVVTRYYDGSLSFEYEPEIEEKDLTSDSIVRALGTFAGSARRLAAPAPDQDEATANLRTALADWATGCQDRLKAAGDLRNAEGAKLLGTLRGESEKKSTRSHRTTPRRCAMPPLMCAASAARSACRRSRSPGGSACRSTPCATGSRASARPKGRPGLCCASSTALPTSPSLRSIRMPDELVRYRLAVLKPEL